jgi:alpha-L-fucosidase
MAFCFHDGRDWFFEARYGLFIHWGLYAIHGFHEQEQWRLGVPRAKYVKLIQRFNPAKFNPDEWLDLAQQSGMRYLCITAKHHDGFCIWDTKQTAFSVMNAPYRKDLIGMLAEACHRRRFPLEFYYSVADWNHPNYPNQGRHHELAGPEKGDVPDLAKYLAFMKEQVRELCTNYGEVHGLWWDMNVAEIRDPSIHEMIRRLQPKAVTNNRGVSEGDYSTPEREYDRSVQQTPWFTKPTEACNSVGMRSWGYRKDEDYYAERFLLQSMDTVFAKGGNYLLNVGPKADGTIPPRSAKLLLSLGQWVEKVKEALFDVEPASTLVEDRGVLLTRRGNTLYVHLASPPVGDSVVLKPLEQLPRRATLLNTGAAVKTANDLLPNHFREKKGYLRLCKLPVHKLAGTVLVVKLEFDALPPTPPAAGASETVVP